MKKLPDRTELNDEQKLELQRILKTNQIHSKISLERYLAHNRLLGRVFLGL